MHEQIAVICIHDDEAIVLALIKKLQSSMIPLTLLDLEWGLSRHLDRRVAIRLAVGALGGRDRAALVVDERFALAWVRVPHQPALMLLLVLRSVVVIGRHLCCLYYVAR
jgi:hypothetical protein